MEQVHGCLNGFVSSSFSTDVRCSVDGSHKLVKVVVVVLKSYPDERLEAVDNKSSTGIPWPDVQIPEEAMRQGKLSEV